MKKQLKRLAALFLALLVCMPCLALAQEAPAEERGTYPTLTGKLKLISGTQYKGIGTAVFPNWDNATVRITLHRRIMGNIYAQCGSAENTGYKKTISVEMLYNLPNSGDYKLVIQAWNSSYSNSRVIDIHI